MPLVVRIILSLYSSRYCLTPASFTFIGSPELGPGTVLGASGSYGSVSASETRSSSTGTSIPVGRHSSNAGAIAGGVIGGIAAISILVAALLFYLRRRRRPLEPIVVFEGDGSQYMNQVQPPMSDQGALVETLPATMAPLKPYVYVFVSLPVAIMCAHVFSLVS